MILDIRASMPVLIIVWQRGLMKPKLIGSSISVKYWGSNKLRLHHYYTHLIALNIFMPPFWFSILLHYQHEPVYVDETPECEYIFNWWTPAACPITVSIHGNDVRTAVKHWTWTKSPWFCKWHLQLHFCEWNLFQFQITFMNYVPGGLLITYQHWVG